MAQEASRPFAEAGQIEAARLNAVQWLWRSVTNGKGFDLLLVSLSLAFLFAFAGLPLVSVVVSDRAWITANFKETDLDHMRAGQPATIELDAYSGSTTTAVP